MTILAIDYGEKNIGLAVGFLPEKVSKPLEVLRRSRNFNEIDEIINKINKWGVELVVIGLALNADGDETTSSDLAKKYAGMLGKKLSENKISVEIKFVNEAGSTKLGTTGLNPKRKRKLGDAYAADIILQNFFRLT